MGSGPITVTCSGITSSFPATGDVITSAIDAGVEVHYSCREGDCSACVAYIKAGTVTTDPGTTLTQDDIDDGFVLACRTTPASGPIHLDFDV